MTFTDFLDSVENPTPEQIEARVKWVEVLRDAKYTPLKGTLCSVDGSERCCLGVALDPVITGIDLKWSPQMIYVSGMGGNDVQVREYEWEGVRETSVLPESIREAMGFTNSNPYVRLGYMQTEALSSLNDKGYPHAVLADLIERQYVLPYLDWWRDGLSE